MMNKVILTGRISTDLELRYTTNNFAVVQFNLATNRPVTRDGERVADFIPCVVWGKQAENLSKYQSKGSLIAVYGSVRIDSYDKQDGSRGYKTYVSVNEVEFLESKKTAGNEVPTETQVEPKEESNPFEEFGQQIQINEEDLPF